MDVRVSCSVEVCGIIRGGRCRVAHMASSHRHGFFLARIIPARSLVSVLPCSCCGLDGNTCASWVVPRLCEEWDVEGGLGKLQGVAIGWSEWMDGHTHTTRMYSMHVWMHAPATYSSPTA